jgi:hypothetical protein
MQKNLTNNAGQKTVQGKKRRGPSDKAAADAGGNLGSLGQNKRARRASSGDGKQSRDLTDERGPHGGSGGGQGNRQNRAVNRRSKTGAQG